MSEQQSSADSAQRPTHPRNSVYFMCQCCEEENPENAVCCREDIGVMPDGTWLCDSCYSDCEKTAYGLIANDVEDFEFPRFEDLPRPAPYIDSALRTEPQTAPTNGVLDAAKTYIRLLTSISAGDHVDIYNARDAAKRRYETALAAHSQAESVK